MPSGVRRYLVASITSEADVNLASVNYHFGSKKELIQAVLDRYLSLFMPALDGRLQTLMARIS